MAAGIAVWVSDEKQKLVSGLTNSTTVQDVIGALVPRSSPDTHVLCQTWCDTQLQVLRPNSKVVKILRSFGELDMPYVRFFIKKKTVIDEEDDELCLLDNSCVSSTSSTSSQCSRSSVRSDYGSTQDLQQNTIEQYSITRDSSSTVKQQHRIVSKKTTRVRASTNVHHKQQQQQQQQQQHIAQRSSNGSVPGCARNSHEKSMNESNVDKLLRLMQEQDAKLKAQMNRIHQIEGEIEKIETDTHVSRMHEDGVNYIQQGYMVPKTLNQDLCMMDQQLQEEKEKIAQLSNQIREENNTSPVSDQVSEHSIMAEIQSLREAMRSSIQVSVNQEKEISQMGTTIQQMQSELENKAECITKLVEELNEESVDQSENKAEITEYSMLQKHRIGANGNLVDNILQRYRANIQNIEDHMWDDDSPNNSGSDSGVSSQEPGGETSSDDSHEEEQQNATLKVENEDSDCSNGGGESQSISAAVAAASSEFVMSEVCDVDNEDAMCNESPSGVSVLDECSAGPAAFTLNETPQYSASAVPYESAAAPLASLDSTHLSSSSTSSSRVASSSSSHLSLLSDTVGDKQAHQISIIHQNLTLTNETLPNDTLQPLDVLVTKETVVTSTPVPQCKASPRVKLLPPPPPQPKRRVAFADHDSVREISIYSWQDSTIVEETCGDEEDEEEDKDDTIVEQPSGANMKCQGEMPSDRFVVNIHPHNLPVPAENISYQQAIYNYSPTDLSHNNFLYSGPVSRLQRKIQGRKSGKSMDMKQKIKDKLLFLPKLAKKSKSSVSLFHAPCAFIEDTFEDSYRYALGPGAPPLTSSLRHSVSQNDITHEGDTNDVTLLRSYTVGDLGRIGYSWIEDHLSDRQNDEYHYHHPVPSGQSCSNNTGLETLV